jgi:hypothetical protein
MIFYRAVNVPTLIYASIINEPFALSVKYLTLSNQEMLTFAGRE